MSTEEFMSFFGMTENKAKETVKNAGLSKYLVAAIKEFKGLNKTSSPPPKKVANMIYAIGSKIKPQTEKFLPFVVKYIADEKLDSEVRVTAALKYLLENLNDAVVDTKRFEEACGIGITVTDDDIEDAVKLAIDQYKDEIIQKRYRFNVGLVLAYVRNLPKMAWADGGKVKIEADQQMIVLLGPKTDEDRRPLTKENKSASAPAKKHEENNSAKKKQETHKTVSEEDNLSPRERIINIMKKLPFHKPGGNYTTEGYPTSGLALDLLKKHVAETGGQVRTRFPPEPNGILHIGHAKAININFGYASAQDGICFLRYDDTNPEKEEERFFKSIREMVEWLGYTPYKITHASDNFDQLYEFAKVLITKGLAYVCHQKADEMKGFDTVASPWRDRPVELNMQLFEDMKAGKFEEGEATLRMKITLEEGKQDPVAYRVRYVPHPKTGTKWCIYPTYDFTHCLCDSLENITHSMCTKEFQNRRSSYYWLCESVETYIPVQWEYGRLNMCYTVVSKRKIAKLITEGIVSDWDDPRLFTLPALRRRGFPSEAVNDFCVRMGVTGATIMVEPAMIEACVRDRLNVTAPRTMAVLEPLKVTLENFPYPDNHAIDVPDFPAVSDSKSHKVSLQKVIYIERTDFRDKADKSYKRFAPDQPVGLRHAGLVITWKQSITGVKGEISEIIATCSKVGEPNTVKPKGFIHWVSNPLSIEVRLYERLFNHKNPEDPEEVPGGFLSDCNKDSLQIVEALADNHIKGSKIYTQYQFERLGFFSVDPDTTTSKLVFNRTVTLKEDSEKN